MPITDQPRCHPHILDLMGQIPASSISRRRPTACIFDSNKPCSQSFADLRRKIRHQFEYFQDLWFKSVRRCASGGGRVGQILKEVFDVYAEGFCDDIKAGASQVR